VSAPLFHVQRGHPNPEELAALTAVLAAKARAAAARSRRPSAPPRWGAPSAAHRRPLPPPGPGAWKRGLWTTGADCSAVGLPSRFGGPGISGWGSGAPANGGGPDA
jgi:Acyl-CoA carboxylase epsilon subunit